MYHFNALQVPIKIYQLNHLVRHVQLVLHVMEQVLQLQQHVILG